LTKDEKEKDIQGEGNLPDSPADGEEGALKTNNNGEGKQGHRGAWGGGHNDSGEGKGEGGRSQYRGESPGGYKGSGRDDGK